MPLLVPVLDDRNYDDLLRDALARISTHNPEWTNFNKSDPGVTLLEVFAFLTENLLYRSNQIPERNRKKFLTLLGVPLQPASSAVGLVTISNDKGPQTVITLNDDLEVRAGKIPFRTAAGLDVLPVEARPYYKLATTPKDEVKNYYNALYQSYTGHPPVAALQFYKTMPFSPRGTTGINLGELTIDKGSLWIALLIRTADAATKDAVERAREALAGKTLSLGLVPYVTETGRELPAGSQGRPEGLSQIQFQLPNMPEDAILPDPDLNATNRIARYRTVMTAPVPVAPTVIEVPLPTSAAALGMWKNLDPLESGVGDFPPALDDAKDEARVITWLRLLPTHSSEMKLLWAGINTVFASQRAHIANESFPAGTGEPDQAFTLSKAPVLGKSVTLRVAPPNQAAETWLPTTDLMSAGPEVPIADPRLPAGTVVKNRLPFKVYQLDPEAGTIRFGDGAHGARPPLDAELRISYDYSVGRGGNVGAGSISSGPALPAGLSVSNPLPTWGGANAESVSDGEKLIPRYLQNRDRAVNATDFESIALRTPGVAIGRVDVISAWHPALWNNDPGDAPGAVTLMLVPRFDPDRPNAPEPDPPFLDAVCAWIDPRRLVTTEVFLRGPVYKGIWISIGINVVAGVAFAPVRDAVEQALRQFLSPLPDPDAPAENDLTTLLATPRQASVKKGWPRLQSVVAHELSAVASRVSGVAWINDLLLAATTDTTGTKQVQMLGLNLPRIDGISVVAGDPVALEDLRGQKASVVAGVNRVPVPVLPEDC